MPWIRRNLRGKKVFVKVTADGTPAAGPDGRVDVKYNIGAEAKIYRASPRNLEETDDPSDNIPISLPGDEGDPSGKTPGNTADDDAAEDAAASFGMDLFTTDDEEDAGSGARAAVPRPVASRAPARKTAAKPKNGHAAAGSSTGKSTAPVNNKDAIIVYTDGACTGNPGPAGIGVVILDGKQRRELSEYLGMGTNNIAELTAIERALEEVRDSRERPVIVHSDSSYSIGLLTKNWKAKANTELVARLRSLANEFPALRFVKVPGHSGVPENERCDELARMAIIRRS